MEKSPSTVSVSVSTVSTSTNTDTDAISTSTINMDEMFRILQKANDMLKRISEYTYEHDRITCNNSDISDRK